MSERDTRVVYGAAKAGGLPCRAALSYTMDIIGHIREQKRPGEERFPGLS